MKKLFIILSFVISISLYAQLSQTKKFQTYDIIVSDLTSDLAAWQFEIQYDKNAINITGIEGGDQAFQEPADYDSRGLTEGRIILAAFTLNNTQAKNSLRIARLHIFEQEGSFANSQIKNIVLANSAGQKIKGKVQIKAINE